MNAASSSERGQAEKLDRADLKQPTPIKNTYEKQEKLHCEIHSDPYAKRTAGRAAAISAPQSDRIVSGSYTPRADAWLLWK
jgi:hypothetical protein